mmetsp:Transcript_7348/g.23468  ORF Transcript_7348/g.23468 Transcript_7348/m.23468 type:complete len:324 (+) Transcript_7348:29-1000(+)
MESFGLALLLTSASGLTVKPTLLPPPRSIATPSVATKTAPSEAAYGLHEPRINEPRMAGIYSDTASRADTALRAGAALQMAIYDDARQRSARAPRRWPAASKWVLAAAAVATLVKSDFGGLLAAYNSALHDWPFSTKALSTGITYVLSDLTAQALERRAAASSSGGSRQGITLSAAGSESKLRVGRALRFGAVGLLWVGPLLAGWFQLMEHFVPGRSAGAVTRKLILDQLVQGPFMIGTMYLLTGVSGGLATGRGFGRSLRQARRTAEQNMAPTWVRSVFVWAPVQALQQVFVPLQHRVLVANGVSYFWDTYLANKMGGEDGS